MSDHFPFFYINSLHTVVDNKTYILRRSHTSKNIESFKTELQVISWDDVLEITDPQIAYTTFFKKLSVIYNKCFPIRKSKSSYYNKKPWLTSNLKSCIKSKNKLYAKSIKHPSFLNDSNYLHYKKVLQKAIRFAERHYYDNKFHEYKNSLVKS